jgi:hypothetical protein
MLTTVIGVLVIAAFICVIVAAIGKCPVWVSVLLLCVVELLRVAPLGR